MTTGSRKALVIGNSDGIGLAVTRKLLARGYHVTGLARSASPLSQPGLRHHRLDVAAEDFGIRLDTVLDEMDGIDLCIHCAGIGTTFDPDALETETATLRVNLMGAAVATERVLARMIAQGGGHFIGLSSIMDRGASKAAPAYAASKTGISAYWEGLGQALEGTGVQVSNLRFGFVDTKMAKAPVRPLMITPNQAAGLIDKVIDRPRLRLTRPRRIALLLWLASLPSRLRYLAS
ncbi:SDR family NAD(P)-dependent oxidoreductase [Sphingomonas colocasiae]|uniref:SDR family NAD(P)-dependent oxidoreductase n=1 Tax=Sphingomonas colocasiae TaxID=1848973 RepID=A0ABS7PPI4_9SPHN|nr:SDR family NAD(P)-dependent oxidoreductase [Sphingomonas colocasiae]MBY8823227.1 SDR family NAD(P)-dependent oxidoreductase [Sphingomonas colocasiae]